ncbi:response regulator [Desulfopila sp. IMCC35008]|uniref:hybrid sensor histidine kinase/response regulator n=1 Tax=Desulfopila sp. IMCC35008 TaxID=2653858 RepID=UPI0013D5FC17|nr:response regulator [Desulfopila sp. IMCC35008]
MRVVVSVLIALLVLALLPAYFLTTSKVRDREQFESHAAIIADDVWAFNQQSADTYLRLALQKDYYKSLKVLEPQGRIFADLENEKLQGIDSFFLTFRLIFIRQMQTDIKYNGRVIGQLNGEQYVRIVYPLINTVVGFLFVLLAGNFVFRLFQNRRQLEIQVEEGARNLLESERRFQDLVNLLPEMVWETDRHGNVSYANQMAHIRLGMSEEAGGHESWLDFIADKQKAAAARYFENMIQGDSPGLSEFNACGADGREFPLLIRSAPIMQDDVVNGARCVGIDISERHDLEEQLRRAQRMKAIGLMAGGVAHDLNNILSGIVTYPELIMLDLDQNSPLRPAIETIRKSGLAAADVVSDLLTVARGAAAARETEDMNELVTGYLESPEYRQLKSLHGGVKVSLDLYRTSLHLSCSSIHIRKCLMNLVTNGVEAIEGIGEVGIETTIRELTSEQATMYSLEAGKYVCLIVSDTGPGIDPADLDHIFEPFYTKKVMGRSGTGLGLTVVWNTVSEHKGVVRVESDKQGTRFELLFPEALPDTQSVSSEKVDWQEFKGKGERILIVDDEPQQREIAARLLTSLDYSVEIVHSGEEAVEFMSQERADLMLLDMLMEPGMSGRETYEQVIRMHPGQKALIVSGFSESEDVKEVLAMGAGGFVHKPYTIAKLGQSVYQELNGVH